MPHTGQRPGIGSYKCESCRETVVLSEENASLPFCPNCKYARYASIHANSISEDITDRPILTRGYKVGSPQVQKISSAQPSDPELRYLDDKLEEALKETFPASDPVQISSEHDVRSQAAGGIAVNSAKDQVRNYNRGQFGRIRMGQVKKDRTQTKPSRNKNR